MSPSISVIIPTLNEEEHLPKLLTDLAAQTSTDFEVIVVDADSDDSTCERAESYQDKLNLRVVKSEKRHLAFQRNLGAQQAQGRYLLFLDADVHIEADFIHRLIESIKESQHLVLLPIHFPHDASAHDEILYRVMAVFTELSHHTNKPFAYGPGAVINRHFFYHLGGYDEEVFVYEDHEIIQRARKRGVQAYLLPKNPIYFSFRRFQSEGRINVLSKYLIATLHLLAKGKVDKEIFSYEMGGSAQYLLKQKRYFNLQKNVNKYFDKLKKLLEE